MERKYQLVAWTENVTDNENARLFMTPSLKSEAQASLIEDIAEIHKEERRSHGIISIDLARRAVTAFEKMSRFEILTGNSRMSFWRLIRSRCWSCTLNIPGRNETWTFI